MLAISVDRPEQSRELAEAYDIDYALLSDPDAAVIRSYGLLHPDGGMEGDIARPAVFVLDREGRIVWRDLTDNWRIRVRPGRILEQLASIP